MPDAFLSLMSSKQLLPYKFKTLYIREISVYFKLLSVCVSIYLSIYLSICLFVCLSECLSVCCPSVRPSVHPSIHRSIYLLALCLSIYLSIYLSICPPSIYLGRFFSVVCITPRIFLKIIVNVVFPFSLSMHESNTVFGDGVTASVDYFTH